MKFENFEYIRPDINELGKKFDSLFSEFESASSASAQYEVLKKIYVLRNNYYSMCNIASIRYNKNINDEFYSNEHDYFDNVNPVYTGYCDKFNKILVNSDFREELEQMTGKQLFLGINLELKTYTPEIEDDLKIENQLVTEYGRLVISAKILFEGKERNISGMSLFTQSDNREVRKKAYEALWKFFLDNETEFDRIFDELVKVRTKMAKKSGYDNFIKMGYDLMGRTDYSQKEVEEFRNSVMKYIVPVNKKLKEMRRKRIGLDHLYYYDSTKNFSDGNPSPKGSPEWITEKAKKMYEELSKESGEFINFMIDGDLLDLYNREGKSPGGKCYYIPYYKSPFIFANMNGTVSDIKVLTHEAGHAFQVYESRNFEFEEYFYPTMDAAEIHSMSMEFITWQWMHLFFEEDTDKYFFWHLSNRLTFIPAGAMVDEFQHNVYENPDMTKEERKKMWRELEKKYVPGIDYGENEFLENGGFWFHIRHIFASPFYYIDYCLADICALQFWRKFNLDRNSAWKDYLNLCKAGGSKSFLELIKIANIDSPFDKITVESIVDYAEKWIHKNEKIFLSAELK